MVVGQTYIKTSKLVFLTGFQHEQAKEMHESRPSTSRDQESKEDFESTKQHPDILFFEECSPKSNSGESLLPNFNKIFKTPEKGENESKTVQSKNCRTLQVEKMINPCQSSPNHSPSTSTFSYIPTFNLVFPSPQENIQNVHYDIECKKCGHEIVLSNKECQSLMRSRFIKSIFSSDSNCFYFTGIPSVALFNTIFTWVSPSLAEMKKPRANVLTQKNQFLLTLIKIRRGFDNRFLSFLFALSISSISTIFTQWVNILDECFSLLLKWPSKEVCDGNRPESFKLFPNTRAIIDCTEYIIERPFMPQAQRITYSNYKHRNTLKQLIAINPNGAIIFLSNLYGGSISDVSIVSKSGFLEKVEENDDIMADRGFNIRHLLLKKKATLNIPAFTHGKNLSLKALKRSRKIASVRIHVERAIRRMKTFKILNGTISLKLRFSLNQITRIVAVLCNLQKDLA